MAPNSIAVQRLNGAKTATYTFVATNPNSHDDIVILSITPSFAPGTWLSLTTNSYASLVTAPNGTTTVVFTGTQGNADATVFAFSFEVKYTIGGGPTEYSSTWTVSAGSVTGSETWYLAGTNYSETNPVIP